MPDVFTLDPVRVRAFTAFCWAHSDSDRHRALGFLFSAAFAGRWHSHCHSRRLCCGLIRRTHTCLPSRSMRSPGRGEARALSQANAASILSLTAILSFSVVGCFCITYRGFSSPILAAPRLEFLNRELPTIAIMPTGLFSASKTMSNTAVADVVADLGYPTAPTSSHIHVRSPFAGFGACHRAVKLTLHAPLALS